MNRAQIYLDAAELLHNVTEHDWWYSRPAACTAIMLTSYPIGDTRSVTDLFVDMFKPDYADRATYWFGVFNKENQEARITALCLMAAMYDGE